MSKFFSYTEIGHEAKYEIPILVNKDHVTYVSVGRNMMTDEVIGTRLDILYTGSIIISLPYEEAIKDFLDG